MVPQGEEFRIPKEGPKKGVRVIVFVLGSFFCFRIQADDEES